MALPRTVRTTILWTHLLMGVTAGIVILIMSLTGVMLAYEHQITDWADGYYVTPPAPNAPRASFDVMLASAHEARQEASPSMVMLNADPTKPASVRLGRTGTLYLDPYTGHVLGAGSAKAHAFFEFIEGWHRWLGASASKYRAMGRMATGVCNFIFLLIVISGAYLWWPRRWNARTLKRIALFDWRLRGKARDFNWHNTIGSWAVVPLFAIVLSSVFMSYQWPTKALNRLSGAPASADPDRRGEGGPGGERGQGAGASREGGARAGSEGRAGRAGRDQGSAHQERSERAGINAAQRRERESGNAIQGRARQGRDEAAGERGLGSGAPLLVLAPGQLDTLWAHAQSRVPVWKSASFRLPAERDRSVSFTLNPSTVNRPDQRVTVEVDIASGQVKPMKASATALGSQARMWARFIHTGEAFGLVGQTVAMLASAGAVFLVWTGIALTLRRYSAWRVRRARRAEVPAAVAVPG